MTDYTRTTWADGYGRWHCRIDFRFGVGNTPDGEALKHRGLAAAKRAIRQELRAREGGTALARLHYVVTANKIDSLNRMWSITVSEDWG